MNVPGADLRCKLRCYKLAFVDTNKESVAVNRAYSVKAFTEEAEAIDWLLDGPA